ncbi:MAG: M20/M25/M40 family metallo-hydrolase [Crocinitomicaceae bacterium]|jgi:putative aminopeptidase FrvX|nr:M20/M25/M40 family metallo-hydrolase [Crocinitomicaceae bacterium]MBT5402448.1 M20/M25/M40 family metallo-hydrolase [Crocinitomicaceae bacterium]MBT6030690.1 M20/M25/M40 family metallo-hydrolase [Crocinitomicaceae bacterium]
MELLKSMCAVHAPAGNEVEMKEFILNYLKSNESSFTVKPEVISGNEIQDCIILKFGKPRTAIFAHMDSIGFTVRYGKQLIKLGGPRTNEGTELIGTDSNGFIDTELLVIEDDSGQTTLEYIADRELDRGTELVFKPNWREDDHFVQCCYMDNRLGCYSALKVAETLENGIICFSCWEETGGGSVGYLGKYIYENYGVQQALISDITWKTEGVHHGKGVAISIRDSGIPRRSYINTILNLARKSGIPFQIEVESSGGSDGNALQKSPYPFDWCFIGAPEDHVHTANEKVHKKDIEAMIEMYKYLMAYL